MLLEFYSPCQFLKDEISEKPYKTKNLNKLNILLFDSISSYLPVILKLAEIKLAQIYTYILIYTLFQFDFFILLEKCKSLL